MYVLSMRLLNLELILFYKIILCLEIDLVGFQLWQFLEISCGYAMKFKPSKARERFKDKCMIYFRNKEQCFECNGLEDWQHSATRGQWSLKTGNLRPQWVLFLED